MQTLALGILPMIDDCINAHRLMHDDALPRRILLPPLVWADFVGALAPHLRQFAPLVRHTVYRGVPVLESGAGTFPHYFDHTGHPHDI